MLQCVSGDRLKFLRKYFESRESRLWGDRVFEYFGIALVITFVCYLIFSLIPNKSLGIFISVPIVLAIVSWEFIRKQKSSNFDELPIDHDLYKQVSWEIAGDDIRIFVSNENAIRILPTASSKGRVFLYQGLLSTLTLSETAALIDLELFDEYTRKKHWLIHYALIISMVVALGTWIELRKHQNQWIPTILIIAAFCTILPLALHRLKIWENELITWFSKENRAINALTALNKTEELVNKSHPRSVVCKHWGLTSDREVLTKAALAQKLEPPISDVKSLEIPDDDEIHVE